jgi:polysaccharide export outer membrane protein
VFENVKAENRTGEQSMNKNLLTKNSLIHRSGLVNFSILLLAAFTFTGCGTTQLDEPAKKPVAEQPHSETIILREGDVLQISFPGSANLDTNQKIRRDGKIALPLVGEVTAAGLTPDELQDNLVKLYAPQISSKEVIVELESSSFPVFVTGCVVHPGKVLSDHPMTALEAIMESGGFDYTKANLKSVKVIRRKNDASENYTLNLKAVLDGSDHKPFYLEPSDIIYVPERFSWF